MYDAVKIGIDILLVVCVVFAIYKGIKKKRG
ncbi:MAG: hypothetical protein PWP53_3566 [Lacrimispora sp.]|nr:hypothetical protein [Lacrimispora sp.]